MYNLRSKSVHYYYTDAWPQTNSRCGYFYRIQSDSIILSVIQKRQFVGSYCFDKMMRFRQREKKKLSYSYFILGNNLDATILTSDNKTFLLSWEYEKSSAKASLFLPSLFAAKLILDIHDVI